MKNIDSEIAREQAEGAHDDEAIERAQVLVDAAQALVDKLPPMKGARLQPEHVALNQARDSLKAAQQIKAKRAERLARLNARLS